MTGPGAGRSGRFAGGVLVGIVVGVVLSALAAAVLEETPVVRSLPERALRAIEERYFTEVDADELEHASVRGMVERLRKRHDDRFSHYFGPESLDEFEAATSGEFSGVGLTVTEVPRGLRVGTVIEDSPAEAAGIEPGSVIVAVDERSIADKPADVATGLIKGQPGTSVELTLALPGDRGRRQVEVERARVRVPAVEGEIRRAGGREVAYVRFVSFTDGAHGELRSEIERLRREGARGLLLDLRGNGGGLLNEAILSASIFVEEGTIVVTESRSQGRKVYEAQGDALESMPMVALVNRDTASAAEILAAALEHYDLATIAGTRSFGKGTFQEVIHLGEGALDLTVGEYLTADGSSLADAGIRPEVRAEDDPETEADEGRRRALRTLAGKLGSR